MAETAVREERIGLQLKNARRNKNLSLTDVAEELKIRKSYIEAIEKGLFSDLPGPTYAIGFVRSYAQMLDLDQAAIVDRFRSEIAGLEKETKLHFLVPSAEKRFPSMAVFGASVALAVAVYGGWYLMGGQSGGESAIASASGAKSGKIKAAGKSSKSPKSAKTSGKGTANAAIKPPVSKTKPAARPIPGKEAEAGKFPVKQAVATGPGVISEAAMRAAADREARERKRIAKAKAAVAARAAATLGARRKAAEAAKRAQASGPVSGKARIVLKATETTWVKLQLTDGTLVFSRILKAGEVFPVVQNRVLLLTAGNAGGLRIIVDGRVLPALGPAGAVRQNIRLDADALLASR
ncbi:MAG TPA: RodZ domain-containing protein [Alphaproteobacteria bacterium]|nr:RodZ domain-containing protein [Alphaproteobacteria bacterium]